MLRRTLTALAALSVAAATAAGARADEDDAAPKPVPRTRPEMKQALEALKGRAPRLPLPQPTPEERERAAGRPVVSNVRARALYLPRAWYAADFKPDPAMTLDDTFKVKLFWIVSRGNNCQYCLGHQEVKLAMAGVAEDEIAALDADWAGFTDAERAAMDFTRKVTLRPHEVGEKDVDALRRHYDDAQLIELIYTVSFFNSVNRWTDSLGLPQDRAFRDHAIELDTPTSVAFQDRPTVVAPASEPERPRLEPREEVLRRLAAARARAPRVELPAEEQARAALPTDRPAGPLSQWVRALSIFPTTGVAQIQALTAVRETGKLDPKLKAQLAWVAAREDRAWYALGDARRRLRGLGQSDDEVFALDADSDAVTPAEREALAFARKLTSHPRQIADADIARLRDHYPDAEVAEIVYVVCAANFFDRFTESLGLALEE